MLAQYENSFSLTDSKSHHYFAYYSSEILSDLVILLKLPNLCVLQQKTIFLSDNCSNQRGTKDLLFFVFWDFLTPLSLQLGWRDQFTASASHAADSSSKDLLAGKQNLSAFYQTHKYSSRLGHTFPQRIEQEKRCEYEFYTWKIMKADVCFFFKGIPLFLLLWGIICKYHSCLL